MALPGGSWSAVPAAREEGGYLVARVSQLSFAVAVSTDAAPPAGADKARAQAAAALRARLTVKPTTPITQTVPALQPLAVRQPITLG